MWSISQVLPGPVHPGVVQDPSLNCRIARWAAVGRYLFWPNFTTAPVKGSVITRHQVFAATINRAAE
ncbi:hypothetical protein, partial [Arthrobacter sp. AOP36-C1-22]|uniref:hypothetical protein n=1 Tax=Arthrobacter sp. AOP36-C1-22 TaxID=3457683 RepID=UPI00403394D9